MFAGLQIVSESLQAVETCTIRATGTSLIEQLVSGYVVLEHVRDQDQKLLHDLGASEVEADVSW